MYLEDRIQQSSFWKFLLKMQRFVMVLSTVAILIVFGIVVLARNIFHFNVIGYDEIVLVGACWMYFIGGSFAACEESQIKADIANMLLSSKNNARLAVVSKLVQVICGVVLVILSYDMIKFDFESNPTTIDWGIPIVISRIAILIGFVITLFYAVVYLMRDYHRLRDIK